MNLQLNEYTGQVATPFNQKQLLPRKSWQHYLEIAGFLLSKINRHGPLTLTGWMSHICDTQLLVIGTVVTNT